MQRLSICHDHCDCSHRFGLGVSRVTTTNSAKLHISFRLDNKLQKKNSSKNLPTAVDQSYICSCGVV